MSNLDLYNEYVTSKEMQEQMHILDENFIFLNENPIIVCGNSAIIDFADEEIHYQDNCMICGKSTNRKWREFRDKLKNGTVDDPYIMTFDCMVDTFGKKCAIELFDTGVIPDEWI